MPRWWSHGAPTATPTRCRDGSPPGRLFYAVFARLGSVRLREGAGDFRLLDRRVVAALAALPERTRFTKGLYAWVGFEQVEVPYVAERRPDGGRSHWGMVGLARHALDGITSFSLQPLRLAAICGAVISALAALYAVVIIGKTIVLGRDVKATPH